ncbi:MAG TPA: M48 family metalloprotease [Pyrinomonadaceae bacterium]|nr:M48 family metalloprotease [Pyrinomonadaceae bacterium]
MKVKRPYKACLLALSVLLASLPVTGFTARPVPAPVEDRFQSDWRSTGDEAPVQAQTDTNGPFKFGKVDLELLAQINLLDQRFEKEGLVFHEAGLDAYLDRVGKAVLAGREIESVSWKFRVLRDPEPNALALPNGSIYINTGMLALLEEEAQLASILAHEIIHVTERHAYLQNRSLRKKVLTVNILGTIGAWTPGATGLGLALSTISPLMLLLSVSGYSRELEKEADLEGLKTLTAAGYEADQMVKVIRLLQMDIEGEQIHTFYSDHPKLQDRVNYLSSSIKSSEDKQSDQSLGDPRTQYLTQMENVDRHDVALAINSGRFRSALYISNKLVNFHPDSSENVFYLAESYRALGPRTALTPAELTGGAKKKAVKDRNKRTSEEQEAELMKTPTGQETWKANQQRSEELYLRALELNRFNAMAHRGLGMLYEKIERKEEAMSEYRKYIELAPNAFDTERIKRRLEGLRTL